MTSLPASDPGSAAVWGSKRINPRPQFCLCLAWSGCPSNDDDDDDDEDKLKVCRLAKQNVPKSVLMSQFKIGKSTLNDILRSEENFTQFKAEKNELGILGAVKTYKAIKNGGFDK